MSSGALQRPAAVLHNRIKRGDSPRHTPGMDKKDWEARYQDQAIDTTGNVPPLLRDNTHLFAGGAALDIAMGTGQNAVFLAEHGYDVTGIDRSSSAVCLAGQRAKNAGVTMNAVEADALEYAIGDQSYDAILDFYFLERRLIPKIKKGLKKNGLIFFETYTTEQTGFGRPSNPDFLLTPNELLTAFLDFFIIYYHERVEESKAIAGLIAQRV